MDIDGGDSLRDKGGCNIGQLFISGTDSSPFSCAQSAKDVSFPKKYRFLNFLTYMIGDLSSVHDYEFFISNLPNLFKE